MMDDVAIAILARAPVPGRAKTRLIPALGAEGAARLQEWLLRRTVALAIGAGLGPVTLWWDGAPEHPALAACRTLGRFESRRQEDGDLGDRMLHAAEAAATPAGVIIIGTDCPALTPEHLRQVARELGDQQAVVIPAEDGGYVLIAVRHPAAELFAGIRWGGSDVMARTRERLATQGWRWTEPATLWDVDRIEDVERLGQMLAAAGEPAPF